jgi:hypothetical protein
MAVMFDGTDISDKRGTTFARCRRSATDRFAKVDQGSELRKIIILFSPFLSLSLSRGRTGPPRSQGSRFINGMPNDHFRETLSRAAANSANSVEL